MFQPSKELPVIEQPEVKESKYKKLADAVRRGAEKVRWNQCFGIKQKIGDAGVYAVCAVGAAELGGYRFTHLEKATVYQWMVNWNDVRKIPLKEIANWLEAGCQDKQLKLSRSKKG